MPLHCVRKFAISPWLVLGLCGCASDDRSALVDAASGAVSAASVQDGGTSGHAATPKPANDASHAACESPCVDDVIVGGGRISEFCDGPCIFELQVDREITLDKGQYAHLSIKNTRRQLLDAMFAPLKETRWSEAEHEASQFEGVELKESYGSALPVDGADAYVEIEHGDGSRTKHSYAAGSPPKELAAADKLVQSLIDQLNACQGELLAAPCTHATE